MEETGVMIGLDFLGRISGDDLEPAWCADARELWMFAIGSSSECLIFEIGSGG